MLCDSVYSRFASRAESGRQGACGATNKTSREDNMKETVGKGAAVLGRRTLLAAGTAALAMPFVLRRARAAAKVLRISAPGGPDEWQSKALAQVKGELDKGGPGGVRSRIRLR